MRWVFWVALLFAAAVGLALTADELAELDKVSALPPEYPGWMHVRQGEYRRQQLREAGLA